MHLYRRKSRLSLWLSGFAAVFALTVGLFWFVSVRMEETAGTEGAGLLQDAISRAVVSCYAIEGRYPANMDYLVENYGIRVDTERYAVSYEVFADNIRPQVRVIRLGEKK